MLYDLAYVSGKAGELRVSVALLQSLSDPFPSVQLSGALAALDAPVDGLIACLYGDVDSGQAGGGGHAGRLCSASLVLPSTSRWWTSSSSASRRRS